MASETYELMRHLTSPIVAITAAHDGRVNGQIVNSAGRASLIPSVPRVMVWLAKYHLTHDVVLASGAFAMHILRTEQLKLVHRLGFRTGRDGAKLQDGEWRTLKSGSPVLRQCYGYFDCRVFRTLDMGPSTLVIGSVLEAGQGEGEGAVLTSPHWRANMPEEWREEFEAQLAEAQQIGEAYLREHPEFAT